MPTTLNIGDMVSVKAFGGNLLQRRVVGLTPTTVLICKDEEYQLSTRENRPPVCVGFPLAALVTVAS
jgi:hypothetical protein